MCVCVFCRGDGGLGREGTQHPNLIQTHSSPEGIKGEWGMGGLFPQLERLYFFLFQPSLPVNEWMGTKRGGFIFEGFNLRVFFFKWTLCVGSCVCSRFKMEKKKSCHHCVRNRCAKKS